jgi:hypothetical protein
MAKLGATARQAFEAHKHDETEYTSFGDLPAGINNGVAKLKDCKFIQIKEGKKTAGEYMFQAVGIVVSPAEFTDADGVTHRVAGGRTVIMEMMCDTSESRGRKTLDEHIQWMSNELRKLGLNTSEIKWEDLEESLKALAETGPYFKFRTWKGKPSQEYPDPRTNHVWEGQMPEDYTPPETGDLAGTVDNTATQPAQQPPQRATAPASAARPQPPANGAQRPGTARTAPAKPTTAQPSKPAAKPGQKQPAPPPPPAPDFTEFGDLDGLLEAANSGDEKAAEELAQLAIKAGATEDQVKEAADWAAVVELITSSSGGDSNAGPGVGDVVGFRPFNSKTKRPADKPVDCEVISVDEGGGTCCLKNLNSDVEYVNVPWDKLGPASS